jgi:dTMP kinase
LPAEVGVARRVDPEDRIEREDAVFFARVTEGFRAIARSNPDRWAVVDASESIEVVARRVRAVVGERLGLVGGDYVR